MCPGANISKCSQNVAQFVYIFGCGNAKQSRDTVWVDPDAVFVANEAEVTYCFHAEMAFRRLELQSERHCKTQ